MTRKIDAAQVLLALAAFLAPLLGGQAPVEAGTLTDGMGGVFGSLLLGGMDTPILAHAIITCVLVAALIVVFLRRRVAQVPNNTFGASILIFLGLLVLSTLLSEFKSVSMAAATEWLAYGVALYAVVGGAGRKVGPTLIVGGIFSGTVLLALLGIAEYGANKGIDPSWRIFALWNNPNALAVMLLAGFLLGVSFVLRLERAYALLSGLGCALIGLALFLTQSKGALLVFAAATFALLVGSILLSPRDQRGVRGLRVGAVIVAVVGLIGLLQVQQKASTQNPAATGALSRLANASSTSEQSAGFRKLLWRTSADLVKRNPVGYGMGTFRFQSSRPGLTTQTQYAHNAYLQLAVEASPLAPLLFIFAILFWTRVAYRGLRTLPDDRKMLLFCSTVALYAVLAHSLVDSDLYYFGVGVSAFMLLGVGFVLSVDSIAPEFLFPAIRRMVAAVGIGVAISMLYFGYVDALKASVRGAIANRNLSEVASQLGSLQSIAPSDGEVWYLTAQTMGKLEAARKAVELAPSTRNLRLLARVEAASGDVAKSTIALERALQIDPNNLVALYQLAQSYRATAQTEEYQKTLERLIGVEATTYYQVRSLPELVPTETFQARLELAGLTTDPKRQIELLKGAVAGFMEYRAKTIPSVLRMAKQSPPAEFGGESLEKAQAKMETARQAAQRLAGLLRSGGDPAGADEADKAAEDFAGAVK